MKWLFLVLFSLSTEVTLAAKFKGYREETNTKRMSFTEPVQRFIETKTDFLILFYHHPSFYFFPKNKQSAVEMRDFLKARIKNRKKLSVDFDPMTLKISTLKDQ